MKHKSGVWLVAGLGFGDEGKGSVVDYLARDCGARTIVRYNGGAQAGHRVVTPDGREHVFSQFGSGMLIPEVRTHLSRFMLIEPAGMLREDEHLRAIGCADAFERTTIDREAPVVTPFHIAANRLIELSRGASKHGSCGLGIGETMEDVQKLGVHALRARDLCNASSLKEKLIAICARKLLKMRRVLNCRAVSEDAARYLETCEDHTTLDWCLDRYADFARRAHITGGKHLGVLLRQGNAIFEGAQGMLLDRSHGFYPHVTKTDITFRNALLLLREMRYAGSVIRIGVVRGYCTRHGNGPFVTEDDRLSALLPDAQNAAHEWQGKFRVGHFDVVAARYALSGLGGIDELAITNLDRLIGLQDLKICTGYELYSVGAAADKLFHVDGNIVYRIAVRKHPDRFLQFFLTQHLASAKPVYESFGAVDGENRAREYAELIAKLLHCPSLLLSFGPAAGQKMRA